MVRAITPSESSAVDTPEQAKMWVDKYHGAGFQQNENLQLGQAGRDQGDCG